jgi:hypothetical protein
MRGVALVVTIVGALAGCGHPVTPAVPPRGIVVATVDGEPIYESDVLQTVGPYLSAAYAEAGRQYFGPGAYREAIGARLFEEKLFVADVGNMSSAVTVPDDLRELSSHYRQQAVIVETDGPSASVK